MSRQDLLERLADRIAGIALPHPVRVAIDGIDAAGKTTLANELAVPLQARGRRVLRASIDGFHRPRAERYRRGKDSPEGYYYDSFDYPGLRLALLDPLGPGGSRGYFSAIFDFRSNVPVCVPEQKAPADAILLFDGVFLLRPELADCWDYSIFVQVDFEIAVVRAVERDASLFGAGSDIAARYRTRYIPGQHIYLQTVRPAEHASVVIENNDPSNPQTLRRLRLAARR